MQWWFSSHREKANHLPTSTGKESENAVFGCFSYSRPMFFRVSAFSLPRMILHASHFSRIYSRCRLSMGSNVVSMERPAMQHTQNCVCWCCMPCSAPFYPYPRRAVYENYVCWRPLPHENVKANKLVPSPPQTAVVAPFEVCYRVFLPVSASLVSESASRLRISPYRATAYQIRGEKSMRRGETGQDSRSVQPRSTRTRGSGMETETTHNQGYVLGFSIHEASLPVIF